MGADEWAVVGVMGGGLRWYPGGGVDGDVGRVGRKRGWDLVERRGDEMSGGRLETEAGTGAAWEGGDW